MNSLLSQACGHISTVLLGKDTQIKLSLTCLLAGGHLLIEDLPGMGKTTLAQCLAKVLGLDYERVQFTSDLLPGDISGSSIYDANTATFTFHSGPLFTQLLLADEINRSTPKTQSALLEAMEEKQVSIEGNTRPLPDPFFVIATQNPLSQAGTYPLPESQLDRFLMCLSLGYPDSKSERLLLSGLDPRKKLPEMDVIIPADKLKLLQASVDEIRVSEQLLDYLQRLIQFTRVHAQFSCGLSPRGAMALLRASKAWALLHNRDHVLPDDVQAVLPSVVEHRVQGYGSARIHNSDEAESLSQFLLSSVEVVER